MLLNIIKIPLNDKKIAIYGRYNLLSAITVSLMPNIWNIGREI